MKRGREHFISIQSSLFMVFTVVFVVSAKILNHLDWIFTAGCVRHFNEGDGLQLVYGDLIGCWSSLQSLSPPPELLIGYLSRKHAI